MITQNQEQRAPLSPADEYNVALQLHNQEFRTLGERTNAFLIVQSLLVAAFAMIRINPELFPYAFPLITGGISIVGILFCFLHYGAGRLGSRAAFRWRQYMIRVENHHPDAPWSWFYGETQCARCERRLLNKPPLPSAWLISPAIFFLVWLAAIAYILIVCCTSPDFCKCFPISALPPWLIVFPIVALIVVSLVVWWLLKRNGV